jgi:hypothetical protein
MARRVNSMTFSHVHIVATAVVCAVAAAAVLYGRTRRAEDDQARMTIIGSVALGLGLFVLVWREASNSWHLNDDFAPAISISDLGSGLIPWLCLLALVPLRHTRMMIRGSGGRGALTWMTTSTLLGLALFVCNVVLI